MNLWKMNCGISVLWIDNVSRWPGIWPLKYTRISYQLYFHPQKPSSSIWLFFSHDTNIHLNETAPMMMPGSTFLLGPFPGHIYHQSQHRLNNRKNYIYIAWSITLHYLLLLDILFPSNHNIHKSSYGLCFWLQNLQLKDFTKINQLKGLKLKNNGHTNFYECCDLTKKVYI